MKIDKLSSTVLISEFMGIKATESFYDSYGRPKPIYTVEYADYETRAFTDPHFALNDFEKQAKFNSSWEWLMPVVEKIESLSSGKDGKYGVHISANGCTIQGTNFSSNGQADVYFNQHYCGRKIDAVYCAVFWFIKYYNEQTNFNTPPAKDRSVYCENVAFNPLNPDSGDNHCREKCAICKGHNKG